MEIEGQKTKNNTNIFSQMIWKMYNNMSYKLVMRGSMKDYLLKLSYICLLR